MKERIMEKPLYLYDTIKINSSPEKVWDTLVNPNKTKQYMYGCKPITDWKVGSTLDWKGDFEGNEMIFVTGLVKEYDPPYKLVYTTFNPNSELENIIKNHLTVTFQLKTDFNKVYLTVTQGDYSKVIDGQKRYDEAISDGKAWTDILKKIQEISEERG